MLNKRFKPTRLLLEFISSVVLIFFVSAFLFPANFVNSGNFSPMSGAGHGEVKIVYCQAGLVCSMHFLKLGSAYAHFLISDQIVIDARHLVAGVVYKPKYGKERTLKSLLEHEVEHSRQLHQLGYIPYLLSKKWMLEGLAEMRSSDHSITTLSLTAICKSKINQKNGSEKYFIYKELVRFFLQSGKTEGILLADNMNYSSALKQYCAHYGSPIIKQ